MLELSLIITLIGLLLALLALVGLLLGRSQERGHGRRDPSENNPLLTITLPGTRIAHRLKMRDDGSDLLVGHFAIELIENGPQVCGA
jgi:hypothetical protein